MERIQPQFIGVELYFDNLEMAKKFYVETLGLGVSDEQVLEPRQFPTGALIGHGLLPSGP